MERKKFWWQTRKLSPQEKEELIRNIEQDASYNEIHYHGCSQPVLGALQKNLNIESSVDVFKAAAPFLGGIGGIREVCGAVIGGCMAIGLVYGREKFEEPTGASNDPISTECRRRGRYFAEKFIREFGYLTCRDIEYRVRGIRPPEILLPADPTPADWDIADRKYPNGPEKCGEVCAAAARLAAETILAPTIVLPVPF